MQAKKPLTDRAIRVLKPAPPGKRRLVWDALVPGLAIRVTETGKRTFVLVVRYPGDRNPSPRALGAYGALTLEASRTKAREWLALIAAGTDPKAHEAARRADTLQSVGEAYLKREGPRLRSIGQRRNILERLVYPKFAARQIDSIRRAEIVTLLDRIEDENGPAMAQYTLAVLRRLFTWHAGRSDEFRSPIVRGMTRVKPSEQRRQRVLTDDEIRVVWRVAEGSGVFGALLQFLLLTAARRNEASRMNRGEVVNGDWTIPSSRYKTGLELVIPLSSKARSVFKGIPQIGKSDLVFTTDGLHPIGGFSKFKRIFDARVFGELRKQDKDAKSLPRWTLHDLRRTARSLMSRGGVSSDHGERALGHVMGGIRGVYDRHAFYDEKKRAFEVLASQVEHIINNKANVVPLRGRDTTRPSPT
jgi:integrase